LVFAVLAATAAMLLLPSPAAAQTGTIISGSIPPTGGFGIIVFGGGTNDQLVAASGCPEETAVFWATSEGVFVPFIPGTDIGAVNEDWNALFPEGIPANTGLVGRCTDDPAGAFTLFSLDRWEPGASEQVTQTDVRVGMHEGFDRVVLEFEGDELPGYRIEYLDGDAVQCGSGTPVALDGNAVMLITLRDTVAHDEGGMPTVINDNPTPAFPALREIRAVCDFEGIVQWAVGIDEEAPFRVFELDDATRLVVDVRH
jgi:hypothetical protein